MPLCVTGMHRSGTSMVARLLNVCGLDLGPEADLLPPGGAVRRACAGIVPTLAHHRAAPGDLESAGLPDGLAACYRALCEEAGWRPAAIQPAAAQHARKRRGPAAPRPAPPAVPG